MSPSEFCGAASQRPETDALNVAVDEALIAPGSWQAVALAPLMPDTGAQPPLVITARFGLQAMVAGNDNPARPLRDMPLAGEPFLSTGGVANDDFLPAPEFSAPEFSAPEFSAPEAPPPRRLRRIVRAQAAAEDVLPASAAGLAKDAASARAFAEADLAEPASAPQPMRVMPMPVQQTLDWQGMRRAVPAQRGKGLDRSSVHSLMVIMVGVWLAVVAFGAYKLSTPTYGAKILWER